RHTRCLSDWSSDVCSSDLDSMRNGEEAQAQTLDWQLRTTFAAGCCGAFVFSWTDEWHRGGADVDDWAFGLTDGERRPKPALATRSEERRVGKGCRGRRATR